VGDFEFAEMIARFRELDPGGSPSDVFFGITTMYMIGRSAMRMADHAADRAAPVWLYELTFETGADGGKWRSPHTLDIPLVFDNVRKSGSMFVDTRGMQAVADAMSDAWIAFARNGDPNSRGRPEWRAWSAAQPTMLFGAEPTAVDGPRRARQEALSDLPYWDITRPTEL
jgi:para-nitrobenzyl esterase